MTGQELRELREQLGLSQAKLAGMLGYAPKTIADYEAERKKITESFMKHVLAEVKLIKLKEIIDSG